MEINFWDFYLSLGANYRTGNTEQTETTSKARIRRRTVNSRFIFDYRGTFTSKTSGSYLHHLLTSLEFELTSILDFDVTWVWDRIEDSRQNPDGAFPKQDDYRLSFMLGLDF